MGTDAEINSNIMWRESKLEGSTGSPLGDQGTRGRGGGKTVLVREVGEPQENTDHQIN